METFTDYSTANHDGRRPCDGYLIEQLSVILEFIINGNRALDARASDETCMYCERLISYLRARNARLTACHLLHGLLVKP